MKTDLAARLRRQAADLLEMANEIERKLALANVEPKDQWVSTGVAEKITGRSASWLRSTARAHPEFALGHKSPTRGWLWNVANLRAFFQPCAKSASFLQESA